MTKMTDRITILTPTYMKADGQWQIVYPGSVLDVPSASAFAGAASVNSPIEAAGTLASHGGPTPVRNFRVR